jgi:hypothetical protein
VKLPTSWTINVLLFPESAVWTTLSTLCLHQPPSLISISVPFEGTHSRLPGIVSLLRFAVAFRIMLSDQSCRLTPQFLDTKIYTKLRRQQIKRCHVQGQGSIGIFDVSRSTVEPRDLSLQCSLLEQIYLAPGHANFLPDAAGPILFLAIQSTTRGSVIAYHDAGRHAYYVYRQSDKVGFSTGSNRRSA